MKKISLFLALVMVMTMAFTSCGLSSVLGDKPDNGDAGATTTTAPKDYYGFDEPFEFDGLTITIQSAYSLTSIDNEYADDYGKPVLRIPITIKNNKDETHSLNMFYYTAFGANGTELSSEGYYFDDGLESAGKLQPGASYTTFMYYLFDGDGEYTIEFDNYSESVKAKFEVKESEAGTGTVVTEQSAGTATPTGHKPGEQFEFDGYAITIGENYEMVKNENQFSDNYGQDVVKLPITIQNNNSESGKLSSFYVKAFGSQGTELDNQDYYFENGLSSAGDMQPGASYTVFMYFIYDGAGDYVIEFDNWTDSTSVVVPIG